MGGGHGPLSAVLHGYCGKKATSCREILPYLAEFHGFSRALRKNGGVPRRFEAICGLWSPLAIYPHRDFDDSASGGSTANKRENFSCLRNASMEAEVDGLWEPNSQLTSICHEGLLRDPTATSGHTLVNFQRGASSRRPLLYST